MINRKDSYNVALVGATGMVGEVMLGILEERKFPIANFIPLASSRSAGTKITFNNKEYTVKEVSHDSFKDVDIAFFAAGGETSLKYVPSAVKAGAIVVDNSSAYRLDKDVPLIVPEVNPHAIKDHKGIIANPNCTTIIMVLALKPLDNYSKIKRVVVSSYQSASGAGAAGMQELKDQVKAMGNNEGIKVSAFAYQLVNNLIPHIDVFLENGYTKEEMKMFDETQKIMESDIKVSATCVRVPVLAAHSESLTIETEKEISVSKAIELLNDAPGVILKDNPAQKKYPMPIDVTGQDICYVGRVRKDISKDNSINLWVVGDQLRKGAATNAVQIAELLIKK